MSRLKSLPPPFPALTALTVAIYLFVFTLPFPLAGLFNTIPPVDYAQLTGRSAGGMAAFAAGLAALFGLYLWAMRISRALPPAAAYSGGLFALLLFFSYPTLAIDLFIYALHSRGWGLYGLNPLANSPANLPPADPWRGLAAEWANAPSPYGPLWEVLNLGAFKLAGGNFLAHLFALKAIAVLAYIACIALVGAILAQTRPEWRATGMLAFAWNPLVLLETAQNGHNDIVMVALMLAVVWALVTNRPGGVMPLLALSVLVKFVTVLLAPFFLLCLALNQPTPARRARAGVIYGLIFAALVAAAMFPLWPGRDTWAVLKAGGSAGRSLMALTILALRPMLGHSAAFDAGRLLASGAWAVVVGRAIWRRGSRPAETATVLYLGWVIFFSYLLLAAPVFHAWYVLWFLPPAILLLPESRPFRASLVFSFTALLIIPYFETVRIWYPALMQNHLLGHAIGVPLLLIPPAWAALKPEGKEQGRLCGL
ncbi:MAG: hypothetical protein ACE5G8_01780 [Anaerolineae bacterium]